MVGLLLVLVVLETGAWLGWLNLCCHWFRATLFTAVPVLFKLFTFTCNSCSVCILIFLSYQNLVQSQLLFDSKFILLLSIISFISSVATGWLVLSINIISLYLKQCFNHITLCFIFIMVIC